MEKLKFIQNKNLPEEREIEITLEYIAEVISKGLTSSEQEGFKYGNTPGEEVLLKSCIVDLIPQATYAVNPEGRPPFPSAQFIAMAIKEWIMDYPDLPSLVYFVKRKTGNL